MQNYLESHHIKYGSRIFETKADYEKFQNECLHPESITYNGCDGVVVSKIVKCDRCDKILSDKRKLVWND